MISLNGLKCKIRPQADGKSTFTIYDVEGKTVTIDESKMNHPDIGFDVVEAPCDLSGKSILFMVNFLEGMSSEIRVKLENNKPYLPVSTQSYYGIELTTIINDDTAYIDQSLTYVDTCLCSYYYVSWKSKTPLDNKEDIYPVVIGYWNHGPVQGENTFNSGALIHAFNSEDAIRVVSSVFGSDVNETIAVEEIQGTDATLTSIVQKFDSTFWILKKIKDVPKLVSVNGARRQSNG